MREVAARGLDQAGGKSFLVIEQDLQKMFGGEALVSFPQGQRLGRLDETAGPFGVFFEIHDVSFLSSARLQGPVRAPGKRRQRLAGQPPPGSSTASLRQNPLLGN